MNKVNLLTYFYQKKEIEDLNIRFFVKFISGATQIGKILFFLVSTGELFK